MSANDPPQRCLDEAVAGSVPAIQRLILHYHDRLAVLADRRIPRALRGRLDPEDLLQQVYIEIVERISEFRRGGPDAFFNWMKIILDSRIADARRHGLAAARDVRREAVPAPSASRADMFAAAADSVTPSRVARGREMQALVLAALAGLSADHRAVLELRVMRGLPLADVARRMDRTPAAVQMLCLRALRRLRESLRTLSAAP